MSGDECTCEKCGGVVRVGAFPFCPHEPTNIVVHGDDVPGGFWAENGFDKPMKFYSHSEHEAALAANGMEIRAKHAGEHDKHLTRWDTMSADKLAWAAEALSRTKRNTFATPIPDEDRVPVEITETMTDETFRVPR